MPMAVKSGQKALSPKILWQMTTPEKTAADQATVAFLLNLIATAKSDRTLSTGATSI